LGAYLSPKTSTHLPDEPIELVGKHSQEHEYTTIKNLQLERSMMLHTSHILDMG
jgi:hypothetical protein